VRTMIRALFPFLLLFVMAGVAAHAGQATFDVTGSWTFEVTTATPTVTLKQDSRHAPATWLSRQKRRSRPGRQNVMRCFAFPRHH